VSLKYINKVSLICDNLKLTNIYIYTFIQNQNFIKKTPFIFPNVIIKRAERWTIDY